MCTAADLFRDIVSHVCLVKKLPYNREFKPKALLSACYEHATLQGRSLFVHWVLLRIWLHLQSPTNQEQDEDDVEQPPDQVLSELDSLWAHVDARIRVIETAEKVAIDLVAIVLFTVRAQGGQTPRESSAASTPSAQSPPGSATRRRLPGLKEQCFLRDKHRCVVTKAFDYDTYRARGFTGARDDEGHGITLVRQTRAAHIIPHSLVAGKDGVLSGNKSLTLQVLRTFNPEAMEQITETLVDEPYNAITLWNDVHDMFGRLELYFDEEEYQYDNCYTIKHIHGDIVLQTVGLQPHTMVTFLDTGGVRAPSRGLLALHKACCLIAYASGAGEYIDQILRDSDKIGVMSDGTTNIGRIIAWKLGLGLAAHSVEVG